MQSENQDFRRFRQVRERRRRHAGGHGPRGRGRRARERAREWIGGLDFVSRDEFEAVKAMAAAARDEPMRCTLGSTRSKPSRKPTKGLNRFSTAFSHACRCVALCAFAWRAQIWPRCARRGLPCSMKPISTREDAAPIDMLESYFAAHGWEHERQDDEVVAKVKGSWTQYELRALWREEDSVLQFLAFPDIRVTDDDRRGAIYEAIGLINEQLWVGHFELWSSSGILLYRHAAMIDGDRRRHAVARRRRAAGRNRRSTSASASIRCSSSCCGAARPPRKRSPRR